MTARHPILAALLLLAGCATSTGIRPVGPGIWFLSEMRAPVRGGGPEARRAVLAEASAFCALQSRIVAPLDLRPDGDPFTPYYPTAFTATFQCAPRPAADASRATP